MPTDPVLETVEEPTSTEKGKGKGKDKGKNKDKDKEKGKESDKEQEKEKEKGKGKDKDKASVAGGKDSKIKPVAVAEPMEKAVPPEYIVKNWSPLALRGQNSNTRVSITNTRFNCLIL